VLEFELAEFRVGIQYWAMKEKRGIMEEVSAIVCFSVLDCECALLEPSTCISYRREREMFDGRTS
jgi:hypothetical protein